jgi:hypothetical protein
MERGRRRRRSRGQHRAHAGNPWIFSRSELPAPGVPAYQGEHNDEILAERNVDAEKVADMKRRKVLLSRRSPLVEFE